MEMVGFRLNIYRTVSIIICFAGLWTTSDGLRVDGSFSSVEDWKFLARFCFMSKSGKLHYIIEYPVIYQTQYLLYYFDRPQIWESVYGTSKTCEQKKSVLDYQSGHLLPLSTVYSNANCKSEDKNGEQIYRCEKTQKFSSSRDMWWFLVVSRCKSDAINKSIVGINITFSFHLTNGEEGDFLHREFSADEFYILPIDISFLLAYLGIVTVSIIFAYLLSKRQLLHSTYKMYMVSLIIWTFHLLLYCIAYGRYGQYGYREKGTERAARVFSALGTIIFMLMLLLMANGFTIVKGRLSAGVTIFLTTFVTVFIIGYGGLLIVEANTFDPGKILYIYEYWPGYGLIALRILGWLTFVVFLFLTLKAHSSKMRFFLPLFVFYTLWFWAGPIVVFIAMYVIDQWAREKAVHGVEQFVMFCGHLFFLILTRPQAANTNFPYHIKTTQIGMLDGTEAERGNNYTLSEDQDSYTSANVSEMFITSREKSIVKEDKTKQLNGNTGTEPIEPPSYVERENIQDMQEAALNAMRNISELEGRQNALPPISTEYASMNGSPLRGGALAPLKRPDNGDVSTNISELEGRQNALSPISTEHARMNGSPLWGEALVPLKRPANGDVSTESYIGSTYNSQTELEQNMDAESNLPDVKEGGLAPIKSKKKKKKKKKVKDPSLTDNPEIPTTEMSKIDSMFSVQS